MKELKREQRLAAPLAGASVIVQRSIGNKEYKEGCARGLRMSCLGAQCTEVHKLWKFAKKLGQLVSPGTLVYSRKLLLKDYVYAIFRCAVSTKETKW